MPEPSFTRASELYPCLQGKTPETLSEQGERITSGSSKVLNPFPYNAPGKQAF